MPRAKEARARGPRLATGRSVVVSRGLMNRSPRSLQRRRGDSFERVSTMAQAKSHASKETMLPFDLVVA